MGWENIGDTLSCESVCGDKARLRNTGGYGYILELSASADPVYIYDGSDDKSYRWTPGTNDFVVGASYKIMQLNPFKLAGSVTHKTVEFMDQEQIMRLTGVLQKIAMENQSDTPISVRDAATLWCAYRNELVGANSPEDTIDRLGEMLADAVSPYYGPDISKTAELSRRAHLLLLTLPANVAYKIAAMCMTETIPRRVNIHYSDVKGFNVTVGGMTFNAWYKSVVKPEE